jgi:hypothetical protein
MESNPLTGPVKDASSLKFSKAISGHCQCVPFALYIPMSGSVMRVEFRHCERMLVGKLLEESEQVLEDEEGTAHAIYRWGAQKSVRHCASATRGYWNNPDSLKTPHAACTCIVRAYDNANNMPCGRPALERWGVAMWRRAWLALHYRP